MDQAQILILLPPNPKHLPLTQAEIKTKFQQIKMISAMQMVQVVAKKIRMQIQMKTQTAQMLRMTDQRIMKM